MSTKKNQRKKFSTDKQTDYLFEYFINEDKFDEQLRGQWDEELEKKIGKKMDTQNFKLDSRITTEKKSSKKEDSISISSSSEKEVELPSHTIEESTNSEKPEAEFDEDETEESTSKSEASQSSTKSIYSQKFEEKPNADRKASDRPLLGDKLIENVEKYVETAEERRARQREAYGLLQDLVERYHVKLSRPYTIDSDPDEMEAEYKMHKERRHKSNQVRFYKNVLINIVCGIEFLNDKYDPFSFKLRDWSKQVAADMDDYTEVLEELYEKYKDRGGKMAPEIRLLFMIIMSGVTYHLSQAMFGSSGIGEAVKNNPNILKNLLGGLMRGSGNQEGEVAGALPPDNRALLSAIKKHNQSKSETSSTAELPTESQKQKDDALALEREKRLLAEQKAHFEEQMRKQNEMYMAQLEHLKNQQLHILQLQQQSPTSNQNLSDINHSLQFRERLGPSDPKLNQSNTPPSRDMNYPENFGSNDPKLNREDFSPSSRTQNTLEKNLTNSKGSLIETKLENIPKVVDAFEEDVFDSEIKNAKSSNVISVQKPNKKGLNLEEMIESLEQSTDIDINDIVETSSRKRNNANPITTSKKPKTINSATRSATRSTSKKTGLETESRKPNIIKL